MHSRLVLTRLSGTNWHQKNGQTQGPARLVGFQFCFQGRGLLSDLGILVSAVCISIHIGISGWSGGGCFRFIAAANHTDCAQGQAES